MYGDVMIQLLSETESELWTVREISVTMVSELYRSFYCIYTHIRRHCLVDAKRPHARSYRPYCYLPAIFNSRQLLATVGRYQCSSFTISFQYNGDIIYLVTANHVTLAFERKSR